MFILKPFVFPFKSIFALIVFVADYVFLDLVSGAIVGLFKEGSGLFGMG